jgi:hypothetical protein
MIEESLWNAIRALEERAMLLEQPSGAHAEGGKLLEEAREIGHLAALVRQAVTSAGKKSGGSSRWKCG